MYGVVTVAHATLPCGGSSAATLVPEVPTKELPNAQVLRDSRRKSWRIAPGAYLGVANNQGPQDRPGIVGLFMALYKDMQEIDSKFIEAATWGPSWRPRSPEFWAASRHGL